jgi:hypothetical protein
VPLDAETIGDVVGVVAGVVVGLVAVVACVAGVAAVAVVAPEVVGAADVLEVLAVLGVVVCAAALAELVVAPPACEARPANRPVPVMAPASDHRVNFVIRRRPASRCWRLLRMRVWRSMSTIVGAGPLRRLGSR